MMSPDTDILLFPFRMLYAIVKDLAGMVMDNPLLFLLGFVWVAFFVYLRGTIRQVREMRYQQAKFAGSCHSHDE
jgi:hypothetical protein